MLSRLPACEQPEAEQKERTRADFQDQRSNENTSGTGAEQIGGRRVAGLPDRQAEDVHVHTDQRG